jgi:hypothetical protein
VPHAIGIKVQSEDLPKAGLGGRGRKKGVVYPRLRFGALGYYMTPLAELSKEVDIFFFFDGAEDSSDSLSQPATKELAKPGILRVKPLPTSYSKLPAT